MQPNNFYTEKNSVAKIAKILMSLVFTDITHSLIENSDDFSWNY